MLDIDTRRRIDTARDILVGKVPDPKSQVEQITIALIYKFMDDMDAESEELGGLREFFAGEFVQYGWSKLMSPALGGFEVLNLYAEAIARMPENPGVPALFREIFKNAYLPYRDPETLRAFLKIIDDFSYDHSERLGDAFEYLLSVLGSQGDAGQFRTPRHIIDFMVEIVAPRKDERILDPACGTAGFLISAYKHILRTNSADGRPGGALSPDEMTRLTNSVVGYDISPDMVRLSLANLYLHGFRDPHVIEYDTLTSDDRWDDYYNVILANPPFMSPKGGIRPHNRFSVQSNRSEVLFVDYIAEHLTPDGRAAVIVPEGVIFQSGKAYMALRETLLDDSLVAVISLPSGVFQPYTGVKTSVLVLDKQLARTRNEILFSNIEHIGMSLGIKRTPTEQNDLPQVLEDYRLFTSGEEVDSDISFSVAKAEILKNDTLLDQKRYRLSKVNPTHVKFVELGEVCDVVKGKSSSTKTPPGAFPLILTAEEFGSAEHYDFEGEAVCVPIISSTGHGRATLKRIHYFSGQFALANLLVGLFAKNPDRLNMRFLYFILDIAKERLASLMTGAANVSMKPADLETFPIPLPPLAVQEAIVAEVESYQRIVDGARQVVENYRPRIDVDPDWPVVALGEVCKVTSGLWKGKRPPFAEAKVIRNTNFRKDGRIDWSDIAELDVEQRQFDGRRLENGDIILEKSGGGPKQPVGRVVYFDSHESGYSYSNFTSRIRVVSDSLVSAFLWLFLMDFYLEGETERFQKQTSGIRNLDMKLYQQVEIPIPPKLVQAQILRDFFREMELIDANRELITRFEQKIAARIARVWGE